MTTVAVIGLGYVGLPLAVAFGRHAATIGFDSNDARVRALRAGEDSNGEVEPEALKGSPRLTITSDPGALRSADVLIVTVPTPIDHARRPDFGPLISASRIVGAHLEPGAIVVYESTVYPGATEEVCVPVLEETSGLQWKRDFHVAYSPERINPGDREHRLETIVKVVAGDDADTLETVAALYEKVVQAGVHRASSIRVAEAAKVIENTQRDLNIALMNELAIIFHRMGLDTAEVLEAAGTKWNFLKFTPGLVGGHCIGVDPYYLTYKAEQLRYHPQVILAGRRINDDMGYYVAEQTVKEIIEAGCNVKGARVNILGLTFKENCPDVRNSRVPDIVHELARYGVETFVHDPLADPGLAREEHGIELVDWETLPRADALIVAVPHQWYRDAGLEKLTSKVGEGGVFADVKSVFDRGQLAEAGLRVWRL